QAEDGIRDSSVTGVQTCALPISRALIKGGADPNLTNGDGATAMTVAIVNDRFDLAGQLLDLGADANDGSLYFAVDMHDATTDMRSEERRVGKEWRYKRLPIDRHE